MSTPERLVWVALTSIAGEAYEARDLVTITKLPAIVVESILSSMVHRKVATWDPLEDWYEAKPTTLEAPWYGCGCSPYLYPTPGQLVVLANGDVVEVQGYTPSPYAVLVSGMGWLGQYRWQCMLSGLSIEEVWPGKKQRAHPWCIPGLVASLDTACPGFM